MRVVSRLTGRDCSIGRRLGLKGKSPSWAYSLRIVFQWHQEHCMQRPVPTESFDSVEPLEAFAQEVRNGSAPAFQEASVARFSRKSARDSSVCSPPCPRIARLASL